MLVCMFFFLFAKEPTNRFRSEFFREPHRDHKNALETIYLINVGHFFLCVVQRCSFRAVCTLSRDAIKKLQGGKSDGDSLWWRHFVQVTSTSAASRLCLYLSRWFCSCWCCCAAAARSGRKEMEVKSTKTPKKFLFFWWHWWPQKNSSPFILLLIKKIYFIESLIKQSSRLYVG